MYSSMSSLAQPYSSMLSLVIVGGPLVSPKQFYGIDVAELLLLDGPLGCFLLGAVIE